jgi:hypothetical protein
MRLSNLFITLLLAPYVHGIRPSSPLAGGHERRRRLPVVGEKGKGKGTEPPLEGPAMKNSSKAPEALPVALTPPLSPPKNETMQTTNELPGMTYGSCSNMTLLIKYDEVNVGLTQTDVGNNLYYPFYDPVTGAEIGNYQDSSTLINGTSPDCSYFGSYNFGSNQQNASTNQIMIQGTCNGFNDAITGGTGIYSGVTGFVSLENFVNDTSNVLLHLSLFKKQPTCDSRHM